MNITNVLSGLQSVLGFIISPTPDAKLPALERAEIALAGVLLRRYAPSADVQNLALSLLTNPSVTAHQNAVTTLDDHTRAVAQVTAAILPQPEAISSPKAATLQPVNAEVSSQPQPIHLPPDAAS